MRSIASKGIEPMLHPTGLDFCNSSNASFTHSRWEGRTGCVSHSL